jgi:hypothetical protein
MKTWSLLLLAALLTFCVSCTKTIEIEDEGTTPRSVCDSIHANAITGNHAVMIGQSLELSVRQQLFDNDFVYINWWGPNNYSEHDHSTIFLNNVKLNTRGWYYVRLSAMNSNCEKIDSVFVNVTMPQGTAPCSLATNSISYSNMGTSPISSVQKTVSQGVKMLVAHSSSGDVSLQFHPYWQNAEPIDGVYDITTNAIRSQTDNGAHEIYMSAVASSIFFQGNTAGQKVYISHVNGKLQAKFCNISMSGNNGMSWTTQISGNLIEQ